VTTTAHLIQLFKTAVTDIIGPNSQSWKQTSWKVNNRNYD